MAFAPGAKLLTWRQCPALSRSCASWHDAHRFRCLISGRDGGRAGTTKPSSEVRGGKYKATVASRRIIVEHAAHFINLTDGAEATMPLMSLGLVDYSFIRLQSSHCECGRPELLIDELDTSMVLAMALGYDCYVYDFGSRNKTDGTPRALWYGLEFIKFVLERFWFGENSRPPIVSGKLVTRQFEDKLRDVSRQSRKKLKYYREFAQENPHRAINLIGVCKWTPNDNRKDFHRSLVRATMSPEVRDRQALLMSGETDLWSQEHFLSELMAMGLRTHDPVRRFFKQNKHAPRSSLERALREKR